MAAVGHKNSTGGLPIGALVDLLRPEFPDLKISKLRFLEAEGLITPERTSSGYRKFTEADCDRVRFVLTAQRDQYLPLKVIKEQLDAIDAGKLAVANGHQRRLRPAGPADTLAGAGFHRDGVPHREVRISRTDLMARAGIDDRFLGELIRAGLIVPGQAGYFDADNVQIAATARAMSNFGLEVRHLRGFKLAADREANLIAQIAGPIARGRNENAIARADEVTRELAGLSVALHATLVRSTIRRG